VNSLQRVIRVGRLAQVNHEPIGTLFRRLVPPAHALLNLLIRRDWGPAGTLPLEGPVIICPNHISNLDPLVVGEYLLYNGRWPHYLAKSEMFGWPLLGPLLPKLGQIPVARASSSARDSLAMAQRAIEQGQLVVIYPEGTITHDPDEWPMAPHTGAARLALRTGVPVIPLGQWGANMTLPPRGIRPARPFPRKLMTVRLGGPVDLSSYSHDDPISVRAAAVAIMDAITEQVELCRGEESPTERWLQREQMRVPRGNAAA